MMPSDQVEQLSDALRPQLTQRCAVGSHPALASVACSLREYTQSRGQQPYGLDDVRLADCVLLQIDLLGQSVPRDTVLTVADGPHAGAWFALDPVSRDDVALVLRLRRSTRHSSATPGATTVR